MWHPACQPDSDPSQLASKEHQQWRERGQPQLQVDSGRYQGQQSETDPLHQQWRHASERPEDTVPRQELSSHLLEYSQAEGEPHGMAANSSPVHNMPMSNPRSLSRRSSLDHTQHMSEQVNTEPLLIPQTHNPSLLPKDDQQLDMRSQYLQDLRNPHFLSNTSCEALSMISERLVSPETQAERASGRPANLATGARDSHPRLHTPAAGVVPSPLAECPADPEEQPGARFACNSPNRARSSLLGAPHRPDREQPLSSGAPHSPDRQVPPLGGRPHSPNRGGPLLRGVPHSPDTLQPLLRDASHSPDRNSDAQASAGNSPAGGKKRSGPKADQQAARTLQEGLSHLTVMSQGRLDGVCARPGSGLIQFNLAVSVPLMQLAPSVGLLDHPYVIQSRAQLMQTVSEIYSLVVKLDISWRIRTKLLITMFPILCARCTKQNRPSQR